jgi:serine/threonine protein kinase
MIKAVDIINGCLHYFITFQIFHIDLLKKRFDNKGANLVYLVEKISSKELFVLKMIDIGDEGYNRRKESIKNAAAEINIGMSIGGESIFLVHYLEMFYYENFYCLILEYCENGDLQNEIDSGKTFEEFV